LDLLGSDGMDFSVSVYPDPAPLFLFGEIIWRRSDEPGVALSQAIFGVEAVCFLCIQVKLKSSTEVTFLVVLDKWWARKLAASVKDFPQGSSFLLTAWTPPDPKNRSDSKCGALRTVDPLPATGQGISLAFDECNGVIFCLFCCFLLMKGC
jgi:hypothetical protein